MTAPGPAAGRWFVSAANRSSGKTTVSIGMCAALVARGLDVRPFKKGPDFIDPMWLSLASRRPCRNLDPHIAGWAAVDAEFDAFATGDAALVEGNHGLFDGFADDGSDTNAALARRLALPVVLVVDTRGTSRGIAPLLLGYRRFDPTIRYAGVVLNRVGGGRHEERLRASIAAHTDFRVLGALPEDARVSIVERHLGLMPANERRRAALVVGRLAHLAENLIDLDALLAVSRADAGDADAAARVPSTPAGITLRPVSATAGVPDSDAPRARAPDPAPPSARASRSHSPVARVCTATIRVGIARDRAFGFYYPGDLEAIEAAGALLVPIDTLSDSSLPALDALLIGGGFPEELAPALAANSSLRGAIRAAIEAGLPCRAECGGLMYLARAIRRGRARHEMVGVLPFDVVMQKRPVGRGYVRLRETTDFPWSEPSQAPVLAHEFHHSSPADLPTGLRYAYVVERGHGVDGRHDGIIHRNLLASYAHLRNVPGRFDWVSRFLSFARRVRAAADVTTPFEHGSQRA